MGHNTSSAIGRGRVTLLLAFIVLQGCFHATVGGVEVEPTGGAGFAGLRNYELLRTSAFSPPAACAAATTCAPVQVIDSVDLIPNHHYEWRPALSTGVIFEKFKATGSQLGAGLGANIVLVPDASGKTSPWPALTAHFGTRENGFFAGLILSPTDNVVLPGGAHSLRVQRDQNPDLIQHNRGRSGHLYIGIRIGGKNQSLNPVAKVQVDNVAPMSVGATTRLSFHIFDSGSNELSNRVCTFATSAKNIADVDAAGIITAVAAGQATITVTCEGVSVTQTVTVH
jgi:hypothetical protein